RRHPRQFPREWPVEGIQSLLPTIQTQQQRQMPAVLFCLGPTAHRTHSRACREIDRSIARNATSTKAARKISLVLFLLIKKKLKLTESCLDDAVLKLSKVKTNHHRYRCAVCWSENL